MNLFAVHLVNPFWWGSYGTVRLTPIGNPVPGYQEFLVAPNETVAGLVKKIRSPTWGMVRQ
jgi:hypothetical protein